MIRYRVDRYTCFLTSELARRKRKMAPTFRGFWCWGMDKGRVVMSSTTLCISSIKRRRRESFTCKQKQQTQLCIKRSSPLYPHGSIWYPHHDDTNHGSHHQQTPLVEATSSPPHEFSGAKAGFLTWADKLFACTTPGLGSRLSQSIEYGGGPSRSRILPCRFSNVAGSLAAHPWSWRSDAGTWGSRRRAIGSGGACRAGWARGWGCGVLWEGRGLPSLAVSASGRGKGLRLTFPVDWAWRRGSHLAAGDVSEVWWCWRCGKSCNYALCSSYGYGWRCGRRLT